jgi:hypothetical protein
MTPKMMNERISHQRDGQCTSNSRPIIIPMSSDALQMVPPVSGKRFISNF